MGISGTTQKSRQRKFVLSSHPGPFALVVSPHKSQTNVGTLAVFFFFFFCKRMSKLCKNPVSQFILPPGQLTPRGASQPRLACPPGGKLSRDILPPTLVIFTPGGQAVQAGLSCPPPNTSKNIYILFCYLSVSF